MTKGSSGSAIAKRRKVVRGGGGGTDLLDKRLLLNPFEEFETELFHLHQTDPHNRRFGVVSPAESIDESSCDGDDILERSTKAHTTNVGSDGDSELRSVEERFPDGSVVEISAADRRFGEGTSRNYRPNVSNRIGGRQRSQYGQDDGRR